MATVFQARRAAGGGEVALKVAHPHLARDPGCVCMFMREALLARRLTPPRIVRVGELGRDGGVHFLAMEYVRGLALAGLLATLRSRGEGLPMAAAVQIAAEIADGLH